MGILEGVKKINEAKKIPRFNLPRTIEFEVGGMKASLRRVDAEIGFPAMAMFGKVLSETMGHILSYSDEHNPENSKLKTLMDLEMDLPSLKSYLFAHALPEIFRSMPECGSELFKVYRMLVPGHLILDGVAIDTYDELKETGVMGLMMLELLWHACEVNFYPTIADQPTADGSAPPGESAPERQAKRPKETKRQKKKSGGTAKGGQSGLMSKRTG